MKSARRSEFRSTNNLKIEKIATPLCLYYLIGRSGHRPYLTLPWTPCQDILWSRKDRWNELRATTVFALETAICHCRYICAKFFTSICRIILENRLLKIYKIDRIFLPRSADNYESFGVFSLISNMHEIPGRYTERNDRSRCHPTTPGLGRSENEISASQQWLILVSFPLAKDQ